MNEGVIFEEGSLLHTSSVQVERALQRRVATEICNMSFIVLSATWSVVMGGHINQSIVHFGPMYTPSWWPSVWFGHGILLLLIVASIVWNCSTRCFSCLTRTCCPSLSKEEGEGGILPKGTADAWNAVGEEDYFKHGFEAMARQRVDEQQPYLLRAWYACWLRCGCTKGMALLVLIVGLLALVMMSMTVLVLRGIGIVVALL